MKNQIALNDAKFANLHLHSDVEPFEIVKVISEKTIEIRRMSAVLDGWKPEIVPGGFSGHCTNQHQQKWKYTSDPTAPVIRCRLRKGGDFHSVYGRHCLSETARKFHDYNF